MTYKSRQYSMKDEHKLMKAIIAQKKSYNDEQERKRQQKLKKGLSKFCWMEYRGTLVM